MAPHLIAFARVLKSGPTLLVLAPRLPAGLLRGKGELVLTADIWGDTSIALADEIQAPALTDLLSRRRRSVQNRNIRIGQILEDWPLAALVSDG
jgi:maltooligosyltrehalose synthase